MNAISRSGLNININKPDTIDDFWNDCIDISKPTDADEEYITCIYIAYSIYFCFKILLLFHHNYHK